jgi:hypothetical protein
MKVRNGFVSNSSSTSFCAWGVYIDTQEIESILGAEVDENVDWYDTFNDIEEAFDTVIDRTKLFYTIGEESLYIGLEYEDLTDDETGKEFKERAETMLKEVEEQLEIIPPFPKAEFHNVEVYSG